MRGLQADRTGCGPWLTWGRMVRTVGCRRQAPVPGQRRGGSVLRVSERPAAFARSMWREGAAPPGHARRPIARPVRLW